MNSDNNNPVNPSRDRFRGGKTFVLLTFGLFAAIYAAIFCTYMSLTCTEETACSKSDNNAMMRYSYDHMARKLVVDARPYPVMQNGLKTGLGNALNHLSRKIALQNRPQI